MPKPFPNAPTYAMVGLLALTLTGCAFDSRRFVERPDYAPLTGEQADTPHTEIKSVRLVTWGSRLEGSGSVDYSADPQGGWRLRTDEAAVSQAHSPDNLLLGMMQAYLQAEAAQAPDIQEVVNQLLSDPNFQAILEMTVEQAIDGAIDRRVGVDR